jgi:uncharacterized cupin superfamily protein
MFMPCVHSRRSFCAAAALFAVSALVLSCDRDKTPPVVAVTLPAGGSFVNGQVLFQVRASDDRGEPVVDFFVDDVMIGSDSLPLDDSLYEVIWDASALDTSSQHRLKAVAFDAGGNSGSAEITVTIGIPTGPTYHVGAVIRPETWDPRGNPHIVTGNLTVSNLLTVRGGAIVQVRSGSYIRIAAGGALAAPGTAGSPVLFTSAAQNPAPGDWQGIEFMNGARGDLTRLDYCTIEYGGEDTAGASLDIRCTPIAMSNCVIRKGPGYGIRTTSDNIGSFTGNTVTAHTGYALRIDSRYLGRLGPDNSFSGNARGIEVFGGTVASSSVWRNQGANYVITRTLEIAAEGGAVLTLEPGTSLRFRPGTGLVVGGTDSLGQGGLLAHGGIGNPVVFTSDSLLPSAGNWLGITLRPSCLPDSVEFDWSWVEYGGGNGLGSIFSDSVPIRLTNTTIRRSLGYGVHMSHAGFRGFAGNGISEIEEYPVRIDPEFVRTLGESDLAGPPRPGVLVVSGRVSSSGTWGRYSYPYVIQGTVEVGDTNHPILDLASGDSLIFLANARIRIGPDNLTGRDSGALTAERVVFTSAVPVPGAWKGIEFLNNTKGYLSHLRGCIVQYAGGDSLGNILCQGSAPLITGDTITNSAAYGIYLSNSSLDKDTLRAYNYFRQNALGDVGP